jgi:hypothetical protein
LPRAIVIAPGIDLQEKLQAPVLPNGHIRRAASRTRFFHDAHSAGGTLVFT